MGLGVESQTTNDTNETNERELKRELNQVGSFLLKSRSFKLIRSQTTHHYTKSLTEAGRHGAIVLRTQWEGQGVIVVEGDVALTEGAMPSAVDDCVCCYGNTS